MDERKFSEATYTRLERFTGEAIPREFTYVVHGGRSCTQFDGAGHLQTLLSVHDVDRPIVHLHELAHVYHCWAFPDLTYNTPGAVRQEACAIAAEVHAALEGENAILIRAVGHRLMVKHPPAAVAVALTAMRDKANETGRDVVRNILEGKYGG